MLFMIFQDELGIDFIGGIFRREHFVPSQTSLQRKHKLSR